MIPIFDTLSHPTLTGRWLHSDKDARIETLIAMLDKANFIGAAAVGIWGVEGYADEPFIEQCRKYRNLVPVAGFNPAHTGTLSSEMQRLQALGFKGIKIHPRFTGIEECLGPRLGNILEAAAHYGLTSFLCTYQHCKIDKYPIEDPFFSIVRGLKEAPNAPVVLVHGGGTELLRYSELVRFNPNLLLDLSLTIMKYAGSSLDADLSFLFRKLDGRISIGTDHPEYDPMDLRQRFESIISELPQEKAENIAFRNILRFLNCETFS